jgi:hypothetical protein
MEVLFESCVTTLRHNHSPQVNTSKNYVPPSKMDSTKIEIKRKQYLDQVGNALRVIYAIIHQVPEKYRDKLRETYTLLVQIYSET